MAPAKLYAVTNTMKAVALRFPHLIIQHLGCNHCCAKHRRTAGDRFLFVSAAFGFGLEPRVLSVGSKAVFVRCNSMSLCGGTLQLYIVARACRQNGHIT